MSLTFDQAIIIFFVESLLYVLIAAITLVKGNSRERIIQALILYVAFSSLWGLSEVAWRIDRVGLLNEVNTYILRRLPIYGILFLSPLLLYLTRAFLHLSQLRLKWWTLAGSWFVLLALLDSRFFGLLKVQMNNNQLPFSNIPLVPGLWAVIGGGIFMAASALLSVKVYYQTRRPLHRNRIRYWFPVLGLIALGDMLSFTWYGFFGTIPRLLGVFVASYVILTHNLPDVRRAILQGVKYSFVTLLTVVVYTAGFIAIQTFFQAVLGYQPLLAGAIVALLLAVLFQPFLALVQRLTNRLLFGAGYDPSYTLREYGANISNILDLERLARVAVGLINDALDIRRGVLFVVHQEENGKDVFHLEGIQGMGEASPPQGTLSANSPVADYLCQEHRPLNQYDIDLLSRFRDMPEEEKAWLSSLRMEVYVPIYAKGEWIGLFGLGRKSSGDRYFDGDLVLLSTLADQTAVALENARLVEDLRKLNQDLQELNNALAQANRQLQEMDKLKSDFIGVITHELRTPFANILFSLELLDRHGRPLLPVEAQELLDQLNSGIESAKKMIDNLITFATFISKQGELKMIETDFSQIIETNLSPLKSLAETKQITLHTETTDSLPPLHADPDRLADAVYHLVHNAIKFTEEGGEVWVRCQSTDGLIRFEVEDTGVGVPANNLPSIWDGFTQMADPLLRGVEGIGMGLALVKYVVQAHGGKVYARSEEGVGSTFGFELYTPPQV